MGGQGERAGGYAVPTYRSAEDTAWYHFLHGNVPGHQIDFMYRPEIPQGPLTRQHFSHLERLIKYIEPHTNSPYAFAIGNLSRDDTQYEPGHGGLGMIFGFRIEGVTDHAGRRDPPFAHGIATVDRNLDAGVIFQAARSFYEHLFSKSGFENPSTVLYQEYVRFATKNPSVLSTVLKAYVEDFRDLPTPESSSLTSKWLANEAAQPKRVVVVHPNDAPFRVIAQCAARIAAMLYQSNIKWSAITNGRESDLPGGVTVRFVAKRDRAAYESEGLVLRLDEVPEEEEGIAEQLFGARPVVREREAAPVQGWRARLQAQAASVPTSTPPPSMPGAGEEGAAGRYGSPDSSERSDPMRGGGALADAEGVVPAPSSKREGDRAARPWTNRAAQERSNEVAPEKPEEIAQVPPARPSAAGATSAAGSLAIDELKARSGVESAEAPLLKEPETNLEPGAGEGSRRSRAWVWIGMALLCAAVIPIVLFVMREGQTQPGDTSGPGPTASAGSGMPSSDARVPPPSTAPQKSSTPGSSDEPKTDVPSTTPPAPDGTVAPNATSTSKSKPPKNTNTGKPPIKDPGSGSPEPPATSPPPPPTTPKPASSVFGAPLKDF